MHVKGQTPKFNMGGCMQQMAGRPSRLLHSVDKETKEVMAVEEAVSAQEEGREGRACLQRTG